jgi:hypothetical protein
MYLLISGVKSTVTASLCTTQSKLFAVGYVSLHTFYDPCDQRTFNRTRKFRFMYASCSAEELAYFAMFIAKAVVFA